MKWNNDLLAILYLPGIIGYLMEDNILTPVSFLLLQLHLFILLLVQDFRARVEKKVKEELKQEQKETSQRYQVLKIGVRFNERDNLIIQAFQLD